MQTQTFKLSVLMPLAAGGHCVHVYSVQHSAGLDWMRQHADTLATRLNGPGYDALYVETPAPHASAALASLFVAPDLSTQGGGRWRLLWAESADAPTFTPETNAGHFPTMAAAIAHGERVYGETAARFSLALVRRFDLSNPAHLSVAFVIHRDGGPRALWRAMNPAGTIPTTEQVEDCAAAFYTAFNARHPGTF